MGVVIGVTSRLVRELPPPNIQRDSTLLSTLLQEHLPAGDKERVDQAIRFATDHHGRQIRADGQPYIVHLLRTATYILMDEPSCTYEYVNAALLHDIVEDTGVAINEIEAQFGTLAATVVDQLTRYRTLGESSRERALQKAAKLRGLSKAPYKVRLIKCWDLADNVLSWKYIGRDLPFFRKLPRWLREAHELYLPFCESTSPAATSLIRNEISELKRSGIQEGDLDSF